MIDFVPTDEPRWHETRWHTTRQALENALRTHCFPNMNPAYCLNEVRLLDNDVCLVSWGKYTAKE